MQRIIVRDDISTINLCGRILEIGPSKSAHQKSTHLLDYYDYSIQYPKKHFIVHDLNFKSELPFSDKYFNYVICSHVIEHIEYPIYYMNEMSRVGKKGIIFLPTKFADNLLSIDGDKYGHKFWFDYGESCCILVQERDRIIKRISTNDKNTRDKLQFNFPNLMEIGFYWEDEIKCYYDHSIKKKYKYKYNLIRVGINDIPMLLRVPILLYDLIINLLKKIKHATL